RVNPVDPTTLYIGLSNYSSDPRIYKVIHANNDDSLAFVDISGNLPSYLPVNWVEVDPASHDSVIFAGTDFGLYYTENGGTTWIKEDNIPNVVVDMIRLRMSDRRLFIYTHGRGVFSARITPYDKQIPSYNPVGIQPTKKAAVRIFPNPASNRVTIEWTVQTVREQREVKVYDSRGRQVRQAKLQSGQQLDLNGLAKGAYYLEVSGFDRQSLMIGN